MKQLPDNGSYDTMSGCDTVNATKVQPQGQFPTDPSQRRHGSKTFAADNRNHSSLCRLFHWLGCGTESSSNRHFVYNTCLFYFWRLPVRSHVFCICSCIFMSSHWPYMQFTNRVISYSLSMVSIANLANGWILQQLWRRICYRLTDSITYFNLKAYLFWKHVA